MCGADVHEWKFFFVMLFLLRKEENETLCKRNKLAGWFGITICYYVAHGEHAGTKRNVLPDRFSSIAAIDTALVKEK